MPKSSAGTVVIITVAGGAALLIYSGLTGVNLSDAVMGKGKNLDASGGKPVTPEPSTSSTPINSEGDPSASGTSSGPHNVPDDTRSGSPVPGQSFHTSTHETGGLPGFPAYDYMAPAGTPCVAPSDGIIIKLSGKDPRLGGSPGGPLGYSIYLKGGGKTYYMTHLDKVSVRVGQRVKRGEQIAVVANGPASWSSPHVHMGVSNI